MSKQLPNILLLTALLLMPLLSTAQTVEIQIVDSEHNPIEYVNAYAKKSQYGAISSLEGSITIDLSKVTAQGSLQFSCIGYEDVKLTSQELGRLDGAELILQDAYYNLDVASVTADKIKYKSKKTGEKVALDLCQIGFFLSKSDAGEERGIIMKNNKSCYLKSVNFNLAFASHDSMIYEVNIYRYEDEQVQNTLNKERIFIQVERDNKMNSIDLRDLNIKVESDYLVSFEAVDVREDEWGIYFKSPCKKSNLYLSKNESGVWSKEKGMGAPSIWCQMECR